MGGAVVLMVAAFVLIAWTGGRLSWSLSAIAVALATLFWGLDNNLTREVRGYSAAYIAQLKGLIAGTVNLLIGIMVSPGGECPRVSMTRRGWTNRARRSDAPQLRMSWKR